MAPLRSSLSTKYCVTCADEKSPFAVLRITPGSSSEALMPAFLATFVNSPLAAKKVVIFVETHVHREPVDFYRPGGRHHEVVGIHEILHCSRCDGDGVTLSDAYFDGRPLKKTENKMRQKERAFSGSTLGRSASDGGITNRPDGLK